MRFPYNRIRVQVVGGQRKTCGVWSGGKVRICEVDDTKPCRVHMKLRRGERIAGIY